MRNEWRDGAIALAWWRRHLAERGEDAMRPIPADAENENGMP
jgi:hypothetical protein